MLSIFPENVVDVVEFPENVVDCEPFHNFGQLRQSFIQKFCQIFPSFTKFFFNFKQISVPF
jgi:hypothetical protein